LSAGPFPAGEIWYFSAMLPALADMAVNPANTPTGWAPIVLLVCMAVVFAVSTVVLSVWIGPKRTGPGKESVYESGMVPVGDARRRFNVRFYIVAMIFLVLDVDIIFFYPWATIYSPAIQAGGGQGGLLLGEMAIFVGLLLLAYFYAWGKGVFRWD
jgi:NADH-quinone oxidoreductase subunit A